MLHKTDFDGLLKDTESGAVLNIDHAKLHAYKKQKQFFENKQKDSERLNKVEQDLSDIKTMLQTLLRENNK